MGQCCTKQSSVATTTPAADGLDSTTASVVPNRHYAVTPQPAAASARGNDRPRSPARVRSSAEANSFTGSPFASPLPAGVAPSPSPASTPLRKFRWPLPPPSPARPIMSVIAKRMAGRGGRKEPIAEERVDGAPDVEEEV